MYDSSSCHALSHASQLTAAFPSTPARRLSTFLSTILVLVAFTALAPRALAAQHQLTLDCEASDVAFLLEATGHDVEGHLQLASGTLSLEPGEAGAASGVASGELVLDATATETGNRRRDKKMHKEVLVSKLHPRIVFHPERYEGTFPGDGEGELQLLGTVELLGASHPLTLTVSYQLADEHFDADVTFDVPFIDWGLEDPSILFLRVDEVVHVNAKVKGSWTAAEAAAASATMTGEPATATTEGR